MTKRASEADFDELHGLTCRLLKEQLTAASEGRLVDPEGNVVALSPALLGQAIKFLKENGVDRPAPLGKKKDTLADAMPDFGDYDESARPIPN